MYIFIKNIHKNTNFSKGGHINYKYYETNKIKNK